MVDSERAFRISDDDDGMEGGMAMQILALQLATLVALATFLYTKFSQIQEKMSRTEAVPGFPSRPDPHWLVGHLMVLRGAEMQVVKRTKVNTERKIAEEEETTHVSSNFVRGYQRVYCDHADPQTGMGSFWFFHIPCVSFLRGTDVKKIMCSSSYRKSVWVINSHTRQLLGANTLLVLKGREWRYFRSAVHKSFRSDVVKESRPFVYQIGNTLANTLLARISQTKMPPSEADDESSSEDCSEDETLPASSPLHSWNEASTIGPIAILPLMKMATIDVFGLVALRSNGVDFGCTRNLALSPLASAFDHLTSEYTLRLKRPWDPLSFLYSIPTKANRDYHRKRNMIRGFISEQIAKTRARITKSATDMEHNDSNNERCDMLTNLIRAADSENSKSQRETKMRKKAHDEALGDVLMTLLFAGYDTTSIALTYALYLLAKNPNKKAKCLAEIDTVFGSDLYSSEVNNNTKGQTLPPGPEELPYTKAIILETLRLFPPAPSTARTIEKPVKISTASDGKKDKRVLTLKEGQMVMLPIWSIQRSELNYPRPNEMIPERWVRRKRKFQNACIKKNAENRSVESGKSVWEVRPEDESEEVTPYSETSNHTCIQNEDDDDDVIPPANRDAFCAFAAGARNCVGKNLAVEESVILLACLVHKLSFELVSENYEISPCLHAVVQQPEDDLPMIVRPRR